MATDLDLKKLTRDIARSPADAARVMAVVTPVIREMATERGLKPTEEQLRLVAQSLAPKLASAAWPDSAATSFEIPVAPPNNLP